MRIILALVLLFAGLSPTYGAMTLVNGKWSDVRYVPTRSVQEHFDAGLDFVNKKEWEWALKNFFIVMRHFPTSPFYAESLFYLGLCNYHLGELDTANIYFSRYLELEGVLKHFEEVIQHKYEIAKFYYKGEKRRLFGASHLPKWIAGKDAALIIYDEVIASLPSSELATQSLYSKGELLKGKKEYKESIEVWTTLTRRFPKHSLAAESFLRLGEVYLAEAELEAQNPDLIAIAQINVARFGKSFPGDERIAEAEKVIVQMKEIFAASLYKTGRFYERKSKLRAAAIYYNDTLKHYPDTSSAAKATKRLQKIESTKKIAKK